MRFAGAAALLVALAACSTPQAGARLGRKIHLGTPGSSKRAAEVQSSRILPWLPGYESLVVAREKDHDLEPVLRRFNLIEAYDRLLLAVSNETGFDLIVEKGQLPGPLPDLTPHVVRLAIRRYYTGDRKKVLLEYAGDMIKLEERTRELRRDLRGKEEEIARLRETLARKEEALAGARKDLKDLQNALAGRDKRLAEAGTRVQQLTEKIRGLEKERERGNATLQELTRQVASIKADLAAAQQGRQALQKELDKARARISSLEGRLADETKQAKALADELAKARGKIKALESAKASAEKSAAEWKSRSEALSRSLQARLEAVRSVLRDLENRVGRIQKGLTALAGGKPSTDELDRMKREVRDLEIGVRLVRNQLEATGETLPEIRRILSRLNGALKEVRERLAQLAK